MRSIRFKSVLMLGMLGCVAALTTGCPGAPADIVVFVDENLEAAIRFELGSYFGPITRGVLLDLNSLDARNLGIRRLDGLEAAVNLQFLDVSNDALLADAITNIEPLKDLFNIRFLNLENNDISDITHVAGLFNLDQLFLAGNQVFNIGPLLDNATNNGLGAGDTVTLERGALFDENGETSPEIAAQIQRLVDLGVDVVLIDSV